MDLIIIGVIINTFGLKGEVKIKSYSDFDEERYKKNNQVYLKYNDEYIPFTVNSFRMHKGMSIVSFKDYLDINLIEKYKGSEIYFDKSKLKPLKKGEFYRFELKGLNVFDQNKKYLGKILNVEETFANNNLRIIKDDETTFLVPYIKEFVLNIDKDKNEVIIKVIEGLL